MSTVDVLHACGQSVWLDFLDRRLLESGGLDKLIAESGVTGLTSNPTIFQKAISVAGAYDDFIGAAQKGEPDAAVLERLMVRDIRAACDRLRPVYDRTGGRDGFASIEVSPLSAHDTGHSIEEAHRLWRDVARPNVMVKIPGTPEGLPAIERCLADGLNINITLLFSVRRYLEVARAHRRALEERREGGRPFDHIASVASFFVSRVDTKVDKALDALGPRGGATARGLRGQIAIANAKLAYAEYEALVDSDGWKALATRGARPQRLLWASTSPKDPAYPDTYYADALVGADTVDTMTLESLRGYLDHGQPEVRLTKAYALAGAQTDALHELGIDLPRIERELEDEGVAAFSDSYHRAVGAIAERRRALSGARPAGATPAPAHR
jgi:transaldolase